MVLVCQVCGEEMRVEENTDLEYIAYLWTLESGAKSYQPTPRDVFVVVNHPHGVEGLIDKRTGERWLERLENGGDTMAINRDRIKRLERDARGDLDSFLLLDGSRYYFDPAEAYKELFSHALDLQLGRVGEPPELFRKLCEAKDPAAVLDRLAPENPQAAFVNVAEMYDRDALINERRLIPLVAGEPEELSEK
jgi:hypothetical protein